VTCHATLPSGGQGGNQAIIDAGVLAKLLTKTDFGIEEALNKFYEIRHGPTRTIVENSDKAILLFTSGLENILSRQAPFQFWGENWNLGIEDIINKSEL
jgi:2-polyprenyl-6-methoxyphenol hydroxylase-like FAD-dependent oxidoreductase